MCWSTTATCDDLRPFASTSKNSGATTHSCLAAKKQASFSASPRRKPMNCSRCLRLTALFTLCGRGTKGEAGGRGGGVRGNKSGTYRKESRKKKTKTLTNPPNTHQSKP